MLNKFVPILLLLAAGTAHAQRADTSSVPGTPSLGDAQIFDGTSFQFQAPPINGTSNVNRLSTGCGVTYTTGLSFVIAPCTYSIAGITYNSVLTTVTLTAADGSNPRIDLLIVDSTGVATKVTGTAAANPAAPAIDPTTQLPLAPVLVPTSSTTPFGVFLENVYLENTEWTCAASDASNNCNSTNNPFAGTRDIEGTTASRTDNVTLTRSAPTVLSNYTNLSFYIRSKAAWPSNCNITWTWQLSGVQQGNGVVLSNGGFGYSSSQTSSYQLIVIPISAFGSIGQADRLTFAVAGAGSCSIGYYIDNIILQGGITTAPTVTGIFPIVVSPTGVVSCPTCSGFGIDQTVVGGIIGGVVSGANELTPFSVATTAGRISWNTPFGVNGPILCNATAVQETWTTSNFKADLSGSGLFSTSPYISTVNGFAGAGCRGQKTGVFPVPAGASLFGDFESLGTSSASGWTASIFGAKIQPFAANLAETVAISASEYSGFAQGAPGSVAMNTDEEVMLLPVPALTVADLCVAMTTSNGAGGSMDVTVRKNKADTACTINIPLSRGQGRTCFSNVNNALCSVAFAAGNQASIEFTNNNAAAVTGTIANYTVITVLDAPATAIIAFPKAGRAFSASTTRYIQADGNNPLVTNQVDAIAGAPRAMVMDQLRCSQKTAPATTTTNFTVYKNGTATTLTAAGTVAAGDDAVISDLTHAISFNADDNFSLEGAPGSGAVGTWPGCTVRVQ